jgi:Fur family ferric uptake transcriptional regulator
MGIIRKTQLVRILLKEFKQSKEALSVVELVDRLNGQMNKTTVYRILDRLEDSGSLHSFIGNDGLKWYALCYGCTQLHHADKHPHFQCRDCGKTECLSLDIVVPTIPNYKVEFAELLLIGQCEDCLS